MKLCTKIALGLILFNLFAIALLFLETSVALSSNPYLMVIEPAISSFGSITELYLIFIAPVTTIIALVLAGKARKETPQLKQFCFSSLIIAVSVICLGSIGALISFLVFMTKAFPGGLPM